MKEMIGRLWRDEKGVTALITALMMLILMGFTGFAADVALWELDGRKIQTAADEAALAGAIAAAVGSNVTSAAGSVAGNFGFVDGQNGASVSVDPNYGGVGQVAVTISALQPQFFSRFFLGAPTVTKTAVAQPPSQASNENMCVLALDRTGKLSVGVIGLNGTVAVNLTNCDLYDDAQSSDALDLNGGAQLSASKIMLSGGYQVSNNAVMSPDPPTATYVAPTPDPYAALAVPSYSGCDQTNFSVNNGSVLTASPGVYCGGITVNGGGTLNLNPGTYILDGGNFDVAGSGTVSGTGVTIILTSSTGSNYGIVRLNGGSIVSLSAPTTGATAGIPGVVLWVDKNAPYVTDTLDGGKPQSISGAIYMPSQDVKYAGGSVSNNTCAQIIAYTIEFTGNANLSQSGCDALDISLPKPTAPPRLVL